MIEIFRAHPAGTLLAAIIIIAHAILAYMIGSAILRFVYEGLTWLIPKLDAVALDWIRWPRS